MIVRVEIERSNYVKGNELTKRCKRVRFFFFLMATCCEMYLLNVVSTSMSSTRNK